MMCWVSTPKAPLSSPAVHYIIKYKEWYRYPSLSYMKEYIIRNFSE